MRPIATLLLLTLCATVGVSQTIHSSQIAPGANDSIAIVTNDFESYFVADTTYDSVISGGYGVTWDFSELPYYFELKGGFEWKSEVEYPGSNLKLCLHRDTLYDQIKYWTLNSAYWGMKAIGYGYNSSCQIGPNELYTKVPHTIEFPLFYGKSWGSQLKIEVPIYWEGVEQFRKKSTFQSQHRVKGVGTLITPFGKFENCLMVEEDVREEPQISLYPQWRKRYTWIQQFTVWPIMQLLMSCCNDYGNDNQYVSAFSDYWIQSNAKPLVTGLMHEEKSNTELRFFSSNGRLEFSRELNGNLEIYDLSGRPVLLSTLNARREIFIIGIPSGMYLVNFVSDDESELVTKKVTLVHN